MDRSPDPFELKNIYNSTKATPDGAALIDGMQDLLHKYARCAGEGCRGAEL